MQKKPAHGWFTTLSIYICKAANPHFTSNLASISARSVFLISIQEAP